MNQEDLRDMLRARPFQTFRLFLTDGAQYDVYYPEMMMLFRRTAILGLGGEPGAGFYDHPVTIGLLHIVRVEPLVQSQASGQSAQN